MAGSMVSCHIENDEKMKIHWTQLPLEGLEGNLLKGVSATYAALIKRKLIVAGGANFPEKLPFEGGTKVYYNDILIFDDKQNRWEKIGQLPDSVAYGVSVPIPGGAIWMGGSIATKSLSACYKVSLPEAGSIELTPFTPLPVTMDNFAGCSVGDLVFVGGGNVDGMPSNAFYCIDIRNDSAWTALPDFPGIPRVQPVMAAVEEEGKTHVYLMGGFFGGDTKRKPAMATDVLRFDFTTQKWEKTGEQTDPDTEKPFSLGGATATTLENRYILCLGGVNHDIFLEAVTTQYNIAHSSSLSDEEKKLQNSTFSKKYMTQPVDYYRFNAECRVYDTKTGVWMTIDRSTNAARAGATLVSDGSVIFAVQGEVKPGVRTPETWGLVIINYEFS